ncbi:Mov34/MPN/PAD-1 family protein [Brevibacillus ruminantium]|uniref:Mov34/MPN/PAD-1 family protein n=1 Tax=Brevibacillus ruminantium TaxID=2950604 RepID=A0ABY4WD11_9BACL|nr:Mov34/MPN/PAD-1 family protein [Brevibacillus ruminantium]USG64043.1 Mov34/MPN/PAD-1 family protein [Brevibacillus ruminantium]
MTSLYFTSKAWRQIEQAVRRKPSLETGGVLMGYPLNDEEWLVTYASGPGPKAVHQPNSIMFDDQHLSNLVKRQSRRRPWKYIGDWHSHTIKRLAPSKGDRQTIWTKASQSKYMSPAPFMLIVGLDKRNQLQARAYTLADKLYPVKNLKLVDRQFLLQRGEKSP